ncbi:MULTISPECIES: SDR family oxidoreductase [unclassified Microcoleus]|uniref:SDR family oxidoreductase n=1 Tax=unclassified Microcoleus TaxID=2642155 RepID=UPI001DAEB953|nr:MULTISPECIES: SDR family oxidoreductase [unclassified Microcoleus]TAE07457.1 MAG: SDR family NAD(P)-dependent oxidoreductase [Oscillatoriales cyanobacterium]MCC3414994.1 SDR family oxidoreductase [Microcoleus sp. PH2017_02_FOX_O_A]MCC3494161.1 SDR family oxidoreductase [Microcoleus sp. PH2017_16_JOR_D_A]MCC3519135.1 SDR family oxidoreductase [Microcoleus sp. PH2017_18_LLB_O_A]MCC3535741.1 SDR family oxidoreductase [Microcoleus sp. PH2017_25_DOB_D_A]
MKTAQHTVLITGGTSGIGLALAKRFLTEGNAVIVTGTNAQKAEAVKRELPLLTVELTDMRDRQALEKLVYRHPAVNILINNAGIQYNYDFADAAISPAQIATELDINLLSPLHLTKLLLPQLLSHPTAAIINVSSGLGIVPKQSAPVYCASKAALHSFTKALRWQLEGTSVRVFEMIPPIVDTAMTQGRGRGKITPEALAEEFWRDFSHDRYEMRIGKTKLLFVLQRFIPALAERIMRPGL